MSVTLEHVTRTVDGIPTIRDVSLTLERGTLSVLLGPTLAGKTSIMRLLAGLDKPTTGSVLVDNKNVTGFDVRQRSVAMVYQQFINYPSFTVYENIASPLRVQGKPRAEIEKRVQVQYKEIVVGDYDSDLIVDGCVLVELKVNPSYDRRDEAQLLNVLKATGLKVGLLVNFGRTKVEYKRLVF